MNESHIVTRTYDLQLNGGKTVHLRLTVAAQLRLKNKFNEDALDVILSASSDPERLLAVLDEALHFNDDPNGDLTGEALYDALVDSGVMLRSGTTITVLETKLLSTGNLWARCPSGWLCIWEKDIDRKFIK